MKELVAKRYVKALVSDLNTDELTGFIDELRRLVVAFGNEKFKNIIASPALSGSQKADFILSLSDIKSVKFTNFVKLLGENKRLEILPNITNELLIQKSKINNVFCGKIYGGVEIDADKISKLEESFSRKFGARIMLEVAKSDYNGIKIELEDLGVEASFSMDRLKAQMSEYILKAI